jgi:putative ABC transport system permease protein
MAVRLALGGSRRDIARQMLVESLVLATVATAVAMLLVVWLTPLLASLAPSQLPRAADIGVDRVVFAVGAAIGVTTALLFGVAPALLFGRVDPAKWMHGGRGDTRTRYRAHNLIVAGEVALAVMLLAGASLFAESLLRLTAEPVGFEPEKLIVAGLRFPRDPAVTAAVRVSRNDALLARLVSVPGVEVAAFTSSAPFSGSGGSNTRRAASPPWSRRNSNAATWTVMPSARPLRSTRTCTASSASCL